MSVSMWPPCRSENVPEDSGPVEGVEELAQSQSSSGFATGAESVCAKSAPSDASQISATTSAYPADTHALTIGNAA